MKKLIIILFILLVALQSACAILVLKAIDTRVDVHVYLPKHAQCAVKMLQLRDSKGKLYPSVREVCHWDNSYAQPNKHLHRFKPIHKDQ